MMQDKFGAVRGLSKVSWFALFGLINAGCYGLSLMMKPKDYNFYFAYKGDGRFSSQFRSMFGSDNLVNVAWTAPSLILGGQYMHSKLGAMTMMKFTPLAMFSIMAFMTAFTPNPESQGMANMRLLNFPFIPKFDCDSPGKHYMGADRLAGSMIYLIMLYHRMWYPALAVMGFDIGYYGPMYAGAPLSAVVAALTLF